ncbi:hypothetical protein GUJ93_ZPchr0011g27846 [Zizania palustris]|uniref:Rapid ALkalinization Factor n=1 Tax=Zizania palustris TaxID=103762 RepID=A0A8J6BKI5_ZIZPA|nr:hypothetical protein GUJ93_ZPchr0011g27846 [Zizania palustris]
MKLILISSVAVALLLLLSSGAGGAFTADHGAVAVVDGMMLVRHIEDDLSSLEMESSAAYPQRRVLKDDYINPALTANQPACLGPCPGRGNPYTGRGCHSKYGCP